MRKIKRANRGIRKYYVVGTICIAMFFTLGIGYAALSQQLDISGTAQITSTWKILFTSAEEKEMNNATTISKQIVNQTTLNLNVELNQPGASATYDVVVENQGNLDAMLTSINGVDEANNQDPKSIKVELQNIRVNDALLAGDKKTFQVKVYWDASVDFDDVNMSKDVQITLIYEQREASEIPSPPPSIDITDEVVTSGDGLYRDQYESGRYVYRGSDPNNYIEFNDELWRIIAKEADGTYKIVRDNYLSYMAFVEEDYRTTANNTYCNDPSSGCNVYGPVSGTFQSPDGSLSGTVTENSSLADYLTGTYYNSLTSTARSQIQTHAFNIGGVLMLESAGNDSITKNLASEKAYTWTGSIGLPNVTDILRASLNSSCTSATDGYKNDTCASNYFLESSSISDIQFWTMNGWYSDRRYNTSAYLWRSRRYGSGMIMTFFSTAMMENDLAVIPVTYLKSTIQITSGNGTRTQPYIILE